ncbi:MAG: phosphate ABC transporter permease subunit PstC [Bacteroidales bacterium]|nr:phosphate ABC transporter permease subunit PstC [Bacteroidales bacterium]
MKEPIEKTGFVFSRESLKKRFRLSEFLAEKIITGVAFLSITIIVLIFFFVFKESLPIFASTKKDAAKIENVQQQEQYGGDTNVATNALGQEQYGLEPSGPVNASGQEQYGVIEADSLMMDHQVMVEDNRDHGSEKATVKSLLGKKWLPVSDNPRYGLIPLFVGTLKITLIAMLFAAPIAILAALFSAAFAPYWLREIIKPAIELLAGFPSVVIGFFALMVMASFFQDIFGYDGRLNAFVGGVAMALAAIPIIFTITEDALTAVPRTYTEASLALGASRWQTALFVTLPAATPGIFAAILLGIGRVFGETMIALMATGNAALTSVNPFESVRTLAATIGAEMAEVVFGDTHYNVLFLIGSLLFIFTFSLNALAEFYVKGKLVKRFQGKQS